MLSDGTFSVILCGMARLARIVAGNSLAQDAPDKPPGSVRIGTLQLFIDLVNLPWYHPMNVRRRTLCA